MYGPDHLLASFASTDQFVVAAFIIAGGLVLGIGAVQFILRHRSAIHFPDLSAVAALRPTLLPRPVSAERRRGRDAARPSTESASSTLTRLGRMCTGLYAWLEGCAEIPDLWTSFDQVLRELLTENLGASRVRCYHVRAGCDALEPISQVGKTPAPGGPSLQAGVLGHAATLGTEFVAGDRSHGPLVSALANSDGEAWAWVWPVRADNATVGVVAVGNLRDPGVLLADERRALGELISLGWHHVACLEHLRVVERTDQASGVLTRNDFFTLAQQALADSYRVNEPVVVAVLALEGLRGLDDLGRWRERDALIERIGRLVARRARRDDLVGRFADDRFVLLLRRLDAGLGRLVAEKMVAAAGECIAGLQPPPPQERTTSGTESSSAVNVSASTAPPPPRPVRLRMAVAASGLAAPPLDDLLVAAFAGVERARKEGRLVAVSADKPASAPERKAPRGPAG